MDKMTIGAKLRLEREKRKMSMNALAEELYIDPASIGRYERNRNDIPARVFLKLCAYFDLKFEDFEGMV